MTFKQYTIELVRTLQRTCLFSWSLDCLQCPGYSQCVEGAERSRRRSSWLAGRPSSSRGLVWEADQVTRVSGIDVLRLACQSLRLRHSVFPTGPDSSAGQEGDDEEQLRWSRLKTHISQKLTTLKGIKEGHQIGPEDGGTHEKVGAHTTRRRLFHVLGWYFLRRTRDADEMRPQ